MRIESLQGLHGQFPDIDGFWDFSSFSNTEAKIRSLLPEGDQSLTPAQLESLTQLAKVQALAGDFVNARASLKIVEKQMLNLAEPEKSRVQLRSVLEQGRIFSLGHAPVKALDLFSKAWTMAKAQNEVFFAIDAAVMMAINQPLKKRQEWLDKALALAEKSDLIQVQLWLAQLYSMSAWTLFDLRRFDEALLNFEKALARPRFAEDDEKIRTLQWSIARTLREVGRVKEAYDLLHVISAEQEKLGKVNGHVSLEIAECLQAQEKHQDAKIYFEKAHVELSLDPWYVDNKQAELARMLFLWKRRT